MTWIAAILGILILFLFPKQMGVLIGVILLGFGATYLYIQAEENEKIQQREAVTIDINYDIKLCSVEYPLHVLISNKSKKIVNKISWNVAAYKSGYSNNVINYKYTSEYGTPYSSDKVLKSGHYFGVCYKTPSLKNDIKPENLKWSVLRKNIVFNSV
ncbi:MAG: hypothetical protein QM500_13060 [Methylococcales bacterium]